MTTALAPHTEHALYNGQHVMILHVDAQDEGNEALISYEDGREEYVPLNTLDLI